MKKCVWGKPTVGLNVLDAVIVLGLLAMAILLGVLFFAV